MIARIYITIFIVFCVFISCQRKLTPQTTESTTVNAPADGFDIQNSDPKAIKIADQVMLAMGGRQSWDDTEYITWNFFGSRKHIWNKKTNDYVIMGIKDTFLIKGNLNTSATELVMKGKEITHADSLTKYGKKAINMWNNDAYWLIMPYKLKDSGVTLKYAGMDSTLMNVDAHKLALTFHQVGDTPDNKYFVYVDPVTHLVNQWDFYADKNDESPRFKIPWSNYQKHGEIMLSSDRGEQYKITDIAVGDTLSRYFTVPLKDLK